MHTKKDYWIQILIAYIFLAIGIVIIKFFKDFSLLGLLFLGFSLLWIIKAVKVFRSLKDKNVYPKKFIQLNHWAKWSLDPKRFRYVFLISLLLGAIIGILIVLYKN